MTKANRRTESAGFVDLRTRSPVAVLRYCRSDISSPRYRFSTYSVATLDVNDRFDTGRKLAMSDGSRPGFFRCGVIIACFCNVGNRPCISELLTIIVMNGSIRTTISRTRNVGAGSRLQNLTGDCNIMCHTSVWLHGSKDAREENATVDSDDSSGPAVVARS